MRIDEFALTPDSFVELLKSGEGQEEFPDDQGPYKLVVYDGDGDEVGEHMIAPELLRAQTRPLFSDTHPQKDEPLEVALPAVGQMCFTQGVGELKVDCVAWGCIATPVQQDITKVAAPDADLSEQRRGDAPEVFNVASPTPKEVNIAGTAPPACPTEPEPEPTPDPGPGPGSGGSGGAGGAGGGWRQPDGGGDTSSPDGEASGKGKNKAGGPTKIAVTSNEDGTVSATGTQKQTGDGRRRRSGQQARRRRPTRIAEEEGRQEEAEGEAEAGEQEDRRRADGDPEAEAEGQEGQEGGEEAEAGGEEEGREGEGEDHRHLHRPGRQQDQEEAGVPAALSRGAPAGRQRSHGVDQRFCGPARSRRQR